MKNVKNDINLNDICSFIEESFQEGNSIVQIKNLRGLVSYLKSDFSIELTQAEELLEKSEKLNNMVCEILNMKDYRNLLNNEFFYTLAVIYSEKNNIELKEPESFVDNQIDQKNFDSMLSSDTDIVKEYLKELDSKILTAEEERELFKRYALGDQKAREDIIYYNLRLVVNIAKKYIGRGIEFLDLVQEGNKGLMRAAEMFDVDKHFKFSTYATWWIRQAITRYIADSARTIRIPVHMNEDINKVDRFIRDYSQSHFGENPPVYLISDELGIQIEKVNYILTKIPEIISLNQPVRPSEDGSDESELMEFVENTGSEDPNKKLFLEQFREVVFNVPNLSDKEKRVIALRFGFVDGRTHTLEEVGKEFNVTRERIRQIEAKALVKLRQNHDVKKFSPYYEEDEKKLSRKIV